jgi:hypothetical protein
VTADLVSACRHRAVRAIGVDPLNAGKVAATGQVVDAGSSATRAWAYKGRLAKRRAEIAEIEGAPSPTSP